ncbi:MAG: CPBP family intramembrane glutamic endopeptidase [Candidatus Thorarchaeota archaeon]|jgi:membrane protease YdiL (CAAX protease family)
MEIKESFFSRRLVLTILVLEALNLVIGLGSRFLIDAFGIDTFMGFLFRFTVNAVFLLILVPFVMMVPKGKRTFDEYIQDIGLRRFRPLSKNIVITVATTVILLGGLLLAALLYGDFVFDPGVIHPANSPIILLSINAGFWEEIMWRGIILTMLLKRFDIRPAIAIDTVLFTVAHLSNLLVGQNAIVMLGQLIFVLIATPILAYIFIKTESLWPGILIHFSIDAFGLIFYQSMIQIGPNILIGGIYMLMGWFVGNILAFVFLRIFLKDEKSLVGEEIENRHPD